MASETKPCTWILLRGLGREAGHWGAFKDKFVTRLKVDEVLTIDLPGTGQHLNASSPASISNIMAQVRSEAIERARHQGQFRLFAMSLGGMVAMEWMRQRPEDLAGVVLVNTSTSDFSPLVQRLRWQVWRDLLKVMAIQSARERERAIVSILFNNPEAQETALPQWTKIALERPVGYTNFLNQLLAAARFKGAPRDSQVPVLLLSGLGDRFVDPSCSTQLHEKLHWPIARHPWAGHDLPWDDPEWVLERVSAWRESSNA